MNKISVSVTDDHVDLLERRQSDGDADSRSAAVRQIFTEYEELRNETAELRTECEDLRNECDELRNRVEAKEDRIDELEEQLARRSQVEEKIEALPDKLRDGVTYQERRQRLLDQASLRERLKWKVTGVPVEDWATDD